MELLLSSSHLSIFVFIVWLYSVVSFVKIIIFDISSLLGSTLPPLLHQCSVLKVIQVNTKDLSRKQVHEPITWNQTTDLLLCR